MTYQSRIFIIFFFSFLFFTWQKFAFMEAQNCWYCLELVWNYFSWQSKNRHGNVNCLSKMQINLLSTEQLHKGKNVGVQSVVSLVWNHSKSVIRIIPVLENLSIKQKRPAKLPSSKWWGFCQNEILTHFDNSLYTIHTF